MNKNLKNFIAYWIALFVLFNLVTFITPTSISGANILKLINTVSIVTGSHEISYEINELVSMMEYMRVKDIVFDKYGGAFWSGYGFVVLTLLLQLALTYYYMTKNNNKSRAVGGPLITLCFFITPIMMITGVTCMIIPDLPNWAGVVICSIILFVQFLLLIVVKSGQEAEYKGNEKIIAKTSQYRSVVANAEKLLSVYKNNKEIKRLVEELKYSSSTSDEYLDEINETVNKLLNKDNVEKNTQLLQELIFKRNKR